MIRRPPRSTQSRSSAASDVYKRQQPNICGMMLSSDPEDVRLLFPDLSSDVHHAPSLINRSSGRATASCLPRVPHLPRDQAGGGAVPLPPPDRVALRCTWILYLDPAPSSLSL